MTENQTFLGLVRLGIGTGTVSGFKSQVPINWPAVKALAEQQGLSAVVLDGIEQLPEQQRPPKVFLLEWIGETLQGYEYRYESYCKAIAELAGFYNSHGYMMMVIKGYACSLDWPLPEHRPCGDIDIWLFGQQKEADALLEAEKPVQVVQKGQEFKVDTSHHHHTVFYWSDFMVENHYDFIDVHHRKSGPKLEVILKELGSDDSHGVELYGEKVYLPSTNLHALFLLYHTMLHFTSIEMSLRQILDCGFFIKKHTKEIDWNWLMNLMEEFHLREFFNIINAICVEDLGFDASIFHGVQFDPFLKDRVIDNIFAPEYGAAEPKCLIPRLYYRYKRWKSNSWKRKLCFSESDWSSFWKGLWAHLLKPKSF